MTAPGATKVALVAFRGELLCFVHVLFNALDMRRRGFEVKIVLEGGSVVQARELGQPGRPHSELFAEVCAAGLIDAVCRACAHKMGALESCERLGLPLRGEMQGHVPLADYVAQGYQVITF